VNNPIQVYDGGLEKVSPGIQRLREALEARERQKILEEMAEEEAEELAREIGLKPTLTPLKDLHD
jgi:hypothetical protein